MIENTINTSKISLPSWLRWFLGTSNSSSSGEIDTPKNSQAEAIPNPVPIAFGFTSKGTRVYRKTKYAPWDIPNKINGIKQ